jgi:glutamate synthase (NADPH/NADH) small chain
VTSFEILPRPPDEPAPHTPWPLWPLMLRTSSSHEEGGERDWSVSTERFLGDEHGRVRALGCVRVEPRDGRLERVAGSELEVPADLVLLAMGFLGPETSGLVADLGVKLDARGNVEVDRRCMTSVKGVFAAGDMQRGQSLVVWAIADGRRAARGIDELLHGRAELPIVGQAGILR